MTEKIVFASDQLPAELNDQQRFSLWHDLYAARYGECDMSAHPSSPFSARTEFVLFGEIGVTRFIVPLDRQARTARQVAADARDDVFIGFNLGTAIGQLCQRDRELVMGAGETMVFTNAEPFATQHDGVVKAMGVSLPRRALHEMVDGLEDRFPSGLDTNNAATRLLERYLEFLLAPQAFDNDPAVVAHISRTMLDLVALSLGAANDAAELATMRGLRAARAREIVAEIKAGFADPAFSPGEVARKFGVSTRYLQDLLQETGASFSERVLELRLQKARTMLTDRRNDRLKVGEIALACGFSGIAYFNQTFRRRFGASPKAYRGGRAV
ncbi:MAG: AraC family transcriptional regulator [Methyloceanibacter sp.]|uniref:AraC family transcriptional regulator n=1 Tax=Methyloceanibacter sp. TaxID=1965321 RepID=UPI003D6C9B01